jgi:UDP-N-acetylmuramate dehydrogenase
VAAPPGNPVSLTDLNSYRLHAEADWCAFPRTRGELARLLTASADARVHLLGHGNNVILSQPRYDTTHRFVCTRFLEAAVSVAGDTIRAGAGARLRDVCRAAARAGLAGLEKLWDIPGSVGGAAYMNAGAYGASFYDVVEAVEVFFPGAGGMQVVSREACRPVYRGTAFQGTDAVILSVTLRLTPGEPMRILREMGRIGKLRRSKLPYDRPSAGSVFRRPEGAPPVGQIMEEAGLKGFRIGGAQISRRHAGIIVNAGGATGADILAVVAVMQEAARKRYGVALVLEQVVI